MATVAAHKALYRDHGFKDNVMVASKVIPRDGEPDAMKYSDLEVVMYHVRPPGVTQARRDAPWGSSTRRLRGLRHHTMGAIAQVKLPTGEDAYQAGASQGLRRDK